MMNVRVAVPPAVSRARRFFPDSGELASWPQARSVLPSPIPGRLKSQGAEGK